MDFVSRYARAVVLVVVAVLIAAACGSDDDSSESTEAAASDGSTSAASSADLEIWQADLAAVGCYGGEIDGQLGPKTEAAVVSYQTAKGLTVDGKLGSETEAALEEDVAAGATVCTSGGSGSQASSASSEELKVWQFDLNAVGCYAGPLDGTDGPQTEAAIHAFQAAKGLTVDGQLGPETQKALTDAVAASETVCTNTGTGDGSGSEAGAKTVTLSAANYENTFTIGSCTQQGESDLQFQGQVDNMTIVVSASGGTGTMSVDGGTEQDGITLNGTLATVENLGDGVFHATGVFGPPNDEGDALTLNGTC